MEIVSINKILIAACYHSLWLFRCSLLDYLLIIGDLIWFQIFFYLHKQYSKSWLIYRKL